MVAITLAASLLWLPLQAAKQPVIWTPIAESDKVRIVEPISAKIRKVAYFKLKLPELRKQIELAPWNEGPDWQAMRRAIGLPMPDGTIRIWNVNRRVFKPAANAPKSGFVPFDVVDPQEPRSEGSGFLNETIFEVEARQGGQTWRIRRISKPEYSIYASFYAGP